MDKRWNFGASKCVWSEWQKSLILDSVAGTEIKYWIKISIYEHIQQ